MSVPITQAALDGILYVAQAPTPGAGPVTLSAGDGSGTFIRVDPQGIISTTTIVDPYSQFWISQDGSKASIMPKRSGGPQPGSRWFTFAVVVVPVTGL